MNNYELSIWEDIIVPENNNTPAHFSERQLGILGGNNIDSPLKAFNVTLKESISGEKTLTFNLMRRYYEENELVTNPFLSLLVNERKIKLRVGPAYSQNLEDEDDEERWISFIIKNIEENKSTYINTYTAKESFVNELGKNGWAIILDTELENNYGTLSELGERILEGSSWVIGDSYTPVETIIEPLFKAIVEANFTATNILNNTPTTITAGEIIYPAYSSVIWDDVWQLQENAQFLYKGMNLEFGAKDVNDNYLIIDEDYQYNYLSTGPIVASGITLLGTDIGQIPLQGKIIVPSIETIYEKVLNRYVKKYKVTDSRAGTTLNSIVYNYDETQYIVSNVVQNILTNTNNFINDSTWLPIHSVTPTVIPKTFVEWSDTTGPLNYLTLPLGSGSQVYYNEGPRGNRLHLIKDKKYVVRMKSRVITAGAEDYGVNGANISTTAAAFPTITAGLVTYNYTATAGAEEVEAVTTTGRLNLLNNADINSSTDVTKRGYGKESTGARYSFDVAHYNSGIYRPQHDEKGYVYTYIEALETNDGYDPYGRLMFKITVEGGSAANALYIEDIQFFEYVEDNNGQPVFLNDTPTASVEFQPHFYYIDNNEAIELSNNSDYYAPVYREGYEAVRHIELKESNYFNNITSLAELFEVWVKFRIKHKRNGQLLLENGAPIKEVIFSKFTPYGDVFNYAGFKYGINLSGITRSVLSDTIATKVIVKNNNQAFATDGMASISRAPSNPSGEDIIYNFDYYVNQNLLDKAVLLRDLYGTSSQDFRYLPRLKSLNNEYSMQAQLLQTYKTELLIIKRFLELYQEAITSTKFTYDDEKYIYDLTDPNDLKIRGQSEITMNQLLAQAEGFRQNVNAYELQKEYYEEKIEEAQIILDNILLEKEILQKDFYKKYSRYILEGTWTDEKYVDDNLYYLDALKVSATNAFPKVNYTINVIDVHGLKGYEAYKFRVGERTYVEDTEFFGWVIKSPDGISQIKTPYHMEVIIDEYVRNFDDPSKSTISVKNYKNQYEDLFQKITATTNQLQYQSGYFSKAAGYFDNDGALNVDSLEQTFAKNAFILANSRLQDVKWDSERGIEITDLLNTNLILRLVSRGLFITSDGGLTWDEAITGQGINTKYLRAGNIDADRINIITNGQRGFRWDGSGISAFVHNPTTQYNANEYVRFNQYGIYGTNNGLALDDILAGESNFLNALNTIQNNANFSLTWDGLYFRNGLGGISLGRFKTLDGDSYETGIRIRNKDGDPVFWTDTNGNVWLSGDLRSKNYITGVAGWLIDREGTAEFENAIIRGMLKSTVFTYDEINAQGGSLIITKSGVLAEDLELPGSEPYSPVTFSTQDDIDIFRVSDTVKILAHLGLDNKIVVWLKITDISNGIYTATIESKQPDTSFTIPAGVPVVSYGKKDEGIILLRADDVSSGPYIDILKNVATNIHEPTSQALMVRLGDLSNVYDNSFGSSNPLSGYGLYAQNAYLTGTVALPNAGISNYKAVNSEGQPIEYNNVRLWAGGSFNDVVADNLDKIAFRVHEDGKMVLQGQGSGAAFTFDPAANKVEFGGGTILTITNIIKDVVPDIYQVIIRGGDILKNESQTILTVQLLKNGLDITSGVSGDNFKWYIGGELVQTGGKELVLLEEDVNGSAEIVCVYTIEGVEDE